MCALTSQEHLVRSRDRLGRVVDDGECLGLERRGEEETRGERASEKQRRRGQQGEEVRVEGVVRRRTAE